MYDCISSDEVAGIRFDEHEAKRLRGKNEPCPEGCSELGAYAVERMHCGWCEGDGAVTPEVLDVWRETAREAAMEEARGGWSRNEQSGEYSDLERYWQTPVSGVRGLAIRTEEADGEFMTVAVLRGREIEGTEVFRDSGDEALYAHGWLARELAKLERKPLVAAAQAVL